MFLYLHHILCGNITTKAHIYIYSALHKYWNSKDKIALLAMN